MKKLLTLVLAFVLALCAFAGCKKKESGEVKLEIKTNNVRVDSLGDLTVEVPADFKIGLITLHGSSSTYDANFINAFNEACDAMGLSKDQRVITSDVPESEECLNAAETLVSAGCKVIFADSFGHEGFIMQAARKYPKVQFCHATGNQAHTAGLANFHNAFASIYEGRFLAGIAAGEKLKEMNAAGKITASNKDKDGNVKIGYVGAFTYAEVISGYTSWFLGVKTALEGTDMSVAMSVRFTGSWYDEAAEREAANALIADGCALISQHADSMGAPSACETKGVPNVSYNGSTEGSCPDTFIISSRINWAPYFKYIIHQGIKGEEIVADWCGTMKVGSVVLTAPGKAAAASTEAQIAKYAKMIEDGTLKVFDVTKDNYITVDGKKITSMGADVDVDENFTPDTEAIVGGCYNESIYRSAPTFDFKIDGITLLNSKF